MPFPSPTPAPITALTPGLKATLFSLLPACNQVTVYRSGARGYSPSYHFTGPRGPLLIAPDALLTLAPGDLIGAHLSVPCPYRPVSLPPPLLRLPLHAARTRPDLWTDAQASVQHVLRTSPTLPQLGELFTALDTLLGPQASVRIRPSRTPTHAATFTRAVYFPHTPPPDGTFKLLLITDERGTHFTLTDTCNREHPIDPTLIQRLLPPAQHTLRGAALSAQLYRALSALPRTHPHWTPVPEQYSTSQTASASRVRAFHISFQA